MTNKNPIPVFNTSGRVVGGIYGDVLYKNAQRHHMLQRPAAWAWDVHIIDNAEWFGARFTEVECDGRVWRASLADFRRHGVRVNRGYGEQIALPLAFWHTRAVGETAVIDVVGTTAVTNEWRGA